MMDALIDLTVKATALLVVVAFIAMLMRRASAASRHQMWAGALCAVALMPIARMGLPALNVAVLQPSALHMRLRPITVPVEGGNPIVFVKIEEPAAAQPDSQSPMLSSMSSADAVAAMWLLGLVVLSARAAGAHLALRRVTSRATVVSDSRVLAMLQEAANAFGVRRRITLTSHDNDRLPCTFGVFRPVILMPASLLTAYAEGFSRLRAVLVHETAHIARLDAISERITQVAVMVFWFNPFIWLAARQTRFERERAADDAVLACGAKASDYASDLLAIARAQSNSSWSSAVPMAASSLERRVRAILDDRIPRGHHSRLSLVATLIVLVVMLPLSAVRLVARSVPLPANVQIDSPQLAAPSSAPVPGPAPIAVQTPARGLNAEQSDLLTVWNTERLRNLRQVLRRARDAHQQALTKAAIGTRAPIDVAVLETTVAQLEEAVKNFTPGSTPLTAQELKSRRAAIQAVLSGLERAELRFTNGLLTTGELANMFMRAASMIEPSIQRPAPPAGRGVDHTSPFTFRPAATPADPSRSQELYSLLTGQVSFVHGAPAASATAAVQLPQTDQTKGQSTHLAAWNAERLANLRQVLERARVAHRAALKRAEIGTTSAEPFSPVPLEATIAALEQTVKAFTPSTTLPTVGVIEGIRAAFATAVRNLEAAEIRFEHGLIRTSDLANALMAAAKALDVGLQPIVLPGVDGRGRAFFFFNQEATAPANPADAMFTEANFPGSTGKDRNSAKELYDLLTGRVQSVSGNTHPGSQSQRGFVFITGEVKNPGKYPIGDSMTVLQLLTLAGGLLPSADKNQIVIVSGTADKDGNPLTRSINYQDIMKGKNLKDNNVELGPGDAVIVRSPGAGYYWQR